MKLINLPSEKPETQPKALRPLSATECRHVAGGGRSDIGQKLQIVAKKPITSHLGDPRIDAYEYELLN